MLKTGFNSACVTAGGNNDVDSGLNTDFVQNSV